MEQKNKIIKRTCTILKSHIIIIAGCTVSQIYPPLKFFPSIWNMQMFLFDGIAID